MSVTYDADAVGFSGSFPSSNILSWEHTSSPSSNLEPGIVVWIVIYRSGVDILTGSTRTCMVGTKEMESKGTVALLNNSIVLECFAVTDQALGSQTITYKYANSTASVRPVIARADSVSYKGVLDFGTLQSIIGASANGSLSATSAANEMLSVGCVSRSTNISATSGIDRFNKNNVTPRFAITDETGATTVNVTMTNGSTNWCIGALRVMATAGPPSPPPPPTLPAVNDNPLGGVLMSVPEQYVVSPDVKLYPLSSSAPSYASPTTFRWDTNASSFRIGGTLTLSDHNSMQCGVNNVSGQSIDTNPLTAGLTSFETEFWVIGGDCTVWFRSFANTDYLILADDKPLTNTWQNFNGSGYQYQRIVFNDDQPHRVRILHGCNGFVGVIVPAGGDIQPAGARFRIAVTGDSYVQGAATASEPGPVLAGGMCGMLSLYLGAEVWNFGQGTTGYEDDGVGGGRTRYGSTGRLATLNARSYDAIIVFGGGNDSSSTPSTVVGTYAQPMWAAIKTAHPTTPLIVVGVQSPDLFPAAGMIALNAALRTAALADSNVDLWIDMRIPEYWVDDTTKDVFITNEPLASIHPGKAGAVNIALRIMHALVKKYLSGSF